MSNTNRTHFSGDWTTIAVCCLPDLCCYFSSPSAVFLISVAISVRLTLLADLLLFLFTVRSKLNAKASILHTLSQASLPLTVLILIFCIYKFYELCFLHSMSFCNIKSSFTLILFVLNGCRTFIYVSSSWSKTYIEYYYLYYLLTIVIFDFKNS